MSLSSSWRPVARHVHHARGSCRTRPHPILARHVDDLLVTAFSFAGNGRRRDDDGVALLDLEGVVCSPLGHARQAPLRGSPCEPVHMHDDACSSGNLSMSKASMMSFIVDVEVAELARDAGVVDHGAAGDDDLALRTCDRGVAHLLQAVHVARERRDEDAALGARDDVAAASRRPPPRTGGEALAEPSRSWSRSAAGRRPGRRSALSAAKSVLTPSMGVWSSLKSPVCSTEPCGARDVDAHGARDGVRSPRRSRCPATRAARGRPSAPRGSWGS